MSPGIIRTISSFQNSAYAAKGVFMKNEKCLSIFTVQRIFRRQLGTQMRCQQSILQWHSSGTYKRNSHFNKNVGLDVALKIIQRCPHGLRAKVCDLFILGIFKTLIIGFHCYTLLLSSIIVLPMKL